MSNALALRSGNSGPQFTGTSGDVLTLQSDGKAAFESAPSGDDHKVAVSSSDTTPDSLNFKLASSPGMFLTVLNPGANEQIKIGLQTPNFLPEHDAGNVTGATNLDVATDLAQRFTLTGNAVVTLTNLFPARAQWLQFKVIQGGVGSFTLSIATAKTPGGSGLTLSAAVGAQDIVSVYWDGTTLYAQVAGLAFS